MNRLRVAIRKQAKPSFCGSISIATIMISTIAGNTPPKACPTIVDPIYLGGNLPATPNTPPWKKAAKILMKTTSVNTTYRKSICHASEFVLANPVIPVKRRIMTEAETIIRLRIDILVP